ncbi:MAG: glycoside hydrolase family 3 N-terminal domain-containing protein [Dysgonomonas sp.]
MTVRKLAIVSVAFFVFISVKAKEKVEPTILRNVNFVEMNQWVDSVFNQMSLDEKIGQTIFVMADGNDNEANRRKLTGFVQNQYIGGILFSKGDPIDQANLTNLCRQNAKTPLMITLDGEWGLSMRLKNTTRFPMNMMLGAVRNDSLLYYYGKEVARQCKLMGIHVNFAPVMDVNSNPQNPVIGRRSFGENTDNVSRKGIMYSKGLEDGGVMAVAKHFPGHGDTSTDSHKVLPLINSSRNRLEDVEFAPFRAYIDSGFSGMLTAHLNIPALDKSGVPSSLSKPIVTGLLQNEMGFSGLIFTDGLAMKGISREADMAVRILQAGNDVLLGPISPIREFNELKSAVENGIISESLINDRCRKILMYKYTLGVQNIKTIDTVALLSELNTSYAEWLSRKLNQESITLLKNDEHILPLKSLDTRKIAAVSIGASSDNSFHKTLKLYDDVDCYSVEDGAGLAKIKTSLDAYNTIIVSIHANKAYNAQAIQNVLDKKNSILVFFTSPYRMSSFAGAIDKADGIVMAYENTDFAGEYAAQAIFGGNEVNGKLPVTVSDIFDEGTGKKIKKTRLSYSLPEELGIPSYKFGGIVRIVREGIDQEAFPGCQILIAKDGVVIYNRSFGSFEYDKKQAVTNEDIFDLASMTKATATIPAVMKLYDEKKITLQSLLSRYVSILKNTNKEDITVREALFHETGIVSFIPYYMPAIDPASYEGKLFNNTQTPVYNALFDSNTWARTDYKYKPELISKVADSSHTLQIAEGLYVNKVFKDTILQSIVNSKLRANKNYLYSCLNFMLLKEVVENVSDTDLNAFVQKNFFSKLGSTTTTYNPLKKFPKDRIVPTEKDDFLRKQLLQGYVHDEGAAFMGGISGNAGLFSDANDLAKLYQMWLNQGEYGDERYLSKETCRLFTTAKSAKSRRGLGFDKPDLRNNKSSPCSPSTPVSTYGHTGFTGTCFWIDPDNNLIYIFLSNRVYDKRTHKNLMSLNIRPRIQEEIYSALKK